MDPVALSGGDDDDDDDDEEKDGSSSGKKFCSFIPGHDGSLQAMVYI
jgi:hypothetical protein